MKIIILISIFSINILAQNIGFTIDGNNIITNETSRGSISGISILGGYNITPKFELEVRLGYMQIPIEYKGLEFSGYLIYLIGEPFYILGNVTLHSNEGSPEDGTKNTNITLLGLGAGIKINSFFSFELNYSKALKDEPWIFHHDGSRLNYWAENIVGVIKANFKFSWQLYPVLN